MGWFGYGRFAYNSVYQMASRLPATVAVIGGAFFLTLPWDKNSLKSNVPTHESRFRRFASVQYNGIYFMTPADFVQSLIREDPFHNGFRTVNRDDFENILHKTPHRSSGSSKFFRQLQTDGIISYSEYLFLLQIVSKPKTGFQIAFKMLDTDNSGNVDAPEFSTMNQAIAHSRDGIESEIGPSDLLLPTDDSIKTTLMVHLFGKRCDNSLSYEDFISFMQNVQTEALEVEFADYSMGTSRISCLDFACILLSKSSLSAEQSEAYISRLKSQNTAQSTISFEEFKAFFNFLNCLGDFSLAMRMYTIADRPISPAEFGRAVKACMGFELSPTVMETLFALFDVDGDGRLSYHEFIQLMKERQTHCLPNKRSKSGLARFRKCVSEQLRLNER